MQKIIVYIFCCWIATGSLSAQESLADSLRAMPGILDHDPSAGQNPCKTAIAELKKNIAAIEIGTFESAMLQFSGAARQFRNKISSNKCQAARRLLSFADSAVTSILAQPEQKADTSNLLEAITYLKYKFLGYTAVKIKTADSASGEILDAVVSIQSASPSVIPQVSPTAQAGLIETYLVGAQSYFITIHSKNHFGYSFMLVAPETDTVLNSRLTKTAADTKLPIPDELSEGQADSVIPWTIAGILFLTSLALLWKIANGKKKELARDDIFPDLPINKPATELAKPYDHTPEKEAMPLPSPDDSSNRNAAIPPPAQTMLHQSNPAGRILPGKYFMAELMVSAGPRKKFMNESNADKDLGEDVCGLLIRNEWALVWLLDGTSDFYTLRNPVDRREYFSSRLLAQCIGRELRSYFTRQPLFPLDQAVSAIIAKVRSNWVEAIARLPDEEKKVLKQNIESGNFPECAATILIGRLSLTGDLDAYRSGDCKMLLFRNTNDDQQYADSSLAVKQTKSNDRIFFRLILKDGQLDIIHNDPLFEIAREKGIGSIIGLSDGIGIQTTLQLIEEYAGNEEKVRTDIMYQLQGTEDDKSLYIVQIKQQA